jgi:hypothetical protein
MPNFPGSENALPSVVVETETFSSGLSLPSGIRLAAVMGEGARREVLVSSAIGGGSDGLNADYTGTNGSDGRHFLLTNVPVISNRTTLYKNGVPLVGLEAAINGNPFSYSYDYRLDIESGQIELQQASFVDQGGRYWKPYATNVGNGIISDLTLVDSNALTEIWTIKVSSILRDGYGEPIDGYAKFIATGSESGTLLDGYGNVITWQSNGAAVSNGVISFAISEGVTPFREGDRFTVQIASGVLQKDDSLVATYIAETDINDPEFFTDLQTLTAKHGTPSTTNRLSLGAQLAFANGVPGLWTLQTAPSIPRRQSYVLVDTATGGATVDDLTFELPVGVLPDVDSNINFFITSPTTGIETQIIPNKVPFYNSTIESNPGANFINNSAYTYSYTAILADAVEKEGTDGYLVATPTQFTLSSNSVSFGIDDLSVTREVRIFNATNPTNNGTFTISNVVNGQIIVLGSTFVTEANVDFQIIDTSEESARILFTDDIAVQIPAGSRVRATLVDEKDSDFYDAGWINAYESLEKIDVDIVVPLPSQTISAIFQNGASHVRFMSSPKNAKERVLFIGAINGLTPENVIGTRDAAVENIGILEGIQGDSVTEILNGNIEDLANYGVQNSYGSTYRVVYFYPDQIVVTIGSDNTIVDGFFAAAAAAGYLSGVPNVALPLTRKSLTGFSILRNKLYRTVTLENLTASGITVLQPITGGGKVVRGQTTTNSGYVEEREISIVFIRDRIAKDLRIAFDGFIGQVESPTFQAAITARAKKTLTGFVNRGLITTFKDLSVSRDTVDPTQWNISVKVQPVYPVNFIYIKVSVGIV